MNDAAIAFTVLLGIIYLAIGWQMVLLFRAHREYDRELELLRQTRKRYFGR